MHTCPHFSRAYVPKGLRAYISFLCLSVFMAEIVSCLNALIFDLLFCYINWCMRRDNNLRPIKKLSKTMDSFQYFEFLIPILPNLDLQHLIYQNINFHHLDICKFRGPKKDLPYSAFLFTLQYHTKSLRISSAI